MNKAIAEAVLGGMAKDPAFQARFGGAEVDPPEAEDRSAVDQPEPESEDSDTAVPPVSVEDRLGKLEKQVEDKQSYITQLQRENQELRERMAAPPETEDESDPMDQFEEYGVPADVARQAIDKRVAEGIRRYLTPYLQVEEAERTLKANPSYAEHAPKLEAFVRDNQDVADVVLALANAGKVKEAKLYALETYKARNAATLEAPAKAASAAQAAARASAKRDAGIAPTQKAESRATKNDFKERDARNLAAAQSGSAREVGKYISDALFRR